MQVNNPLYLAAAPPGVAPACLVPALTAAYISSAAWLAWDEGEEPIRGLQTITEVKKQMQATDRAVLRQLRNQETTGRVPAKSMCVHVCAHVCMCVRMCARAPL